MTAKALVLPMVHRESETQELVRTLEIISVEAVYPAP